MIKLRLDATVTFASHSETEVLCVSVCRISVITSSVLLITGVEPRLLFNRLRAVEVVDNELLCCSDILGKLHLWCHYLKGKTIIMLSNSILGVFLDLTITL